MATAKVSPLSSHTQFPIANNLDTREIAQESFALAHGCSLHMAIIQQPARKWEKPWRHQRAIVLFARSPEETKLRLQLEGRMRQNERALELSHGADNLEHEPAGWSAQVQVVPQADEGQPEGLQFGERIDQMAQRSAGHSSPEVTQAYIRHQIGHLKKVCRSTHPRAQRRPHAAK